VKQYEVVLLRRVEEIGADVVDPDKIAAAIQNAVNGGWRLFQIATGGTAQRKRIGAGPESLVCWVYLVFEREG
jgi:hypothetical protein